MFFFFTAKVVNGCMQPDTTLLFVWFDRENTKRGALLHGVPYGVPKMEYP